MPSKFTLYDLDTTTDYLGFESFCNDLMSREGYQSIHPLGGYKDKGRDAIHFDRSTGIATVLSYSVRDDWEDKLNGDLKKVQKHEHECQRFVFVTAAEVSPSSFDRLRARVRNDYGWDFDVFARDRIATLVDNQHTDLLARHPGIFQMASFTRDRASHTELNAQQYAAYLLRQYEVWVEQYTPLLAAHKDLDTFVNLRERKEPSPLPVADLPYLSPLSLLLGESGAGKTTSLWKIAVRAATRLRDGESDRIPVLLNLRSWASNRRIADLLQDCFEPFELEPSALRRELNSGKLLLLIDGLNEVGRSTVNDCAYDVVNFIAAHPDNSYVISCRSADFSPSLLPTGDAKPPIREPSIYEICRLNKEQMLDYVRSYGARYRIDVEGFLKRLDVETDDAWETASNALQLARIPLYLQVFLDVFRQTGKLAHSRAELLRGLVEQVLLREESRGRLRVDRFANERALGYIAFQSTAHSHALRFGSGYAQDLAQHALGILRRDSVISADVTVGEVWGHLLSANFLKLARNDAVEWLHQLLRDYFLGTEFARIWRAGNHPDRSKLGQRFGDRTWDVACTIALSILGEQHGPEFLLELIRAYGENARRAFEGQTEEMRTRLAGSIVNQTLAECDPETLVLKQLSRVLPYAEIVDSLDQHFYDADPSMRIPLMEGISQILFEHLPTVTGGPGIFRSPEVDPWARLCRYGTTRAATRRAAEVLCKYLRNRDDLISFHAAKGLYESDRAAAVQQLRKLAASSNSRVRSLVAGLVDEWGLE